MRKYSVGLTVVIVILIGTIMLLTMKLSEKEENISSTMSQVSVLEKKTADLTNENNTLKTSIGDLII